MSTPSDFTSKGSLLKRLSSNQILMGVCLGIFALLLRFPDFFYYEIDWDESSYVLMGQELLAGRLPYTHLWEFKPPLLFVPYAASIFLFGRTIVGIRLLGYLCVVATGFLAWKITAKHHHPLAALAAGIFAITFASVLPAGQATMSEIVTLPILCWCLLAVLELPDENPPLFRLGVLLDMLTLFRLNMAYVTVATVLLIGYRWYQKRPADMMKQAGRLALGLILPFAVLVAVYVLAGSSETLKKLFWDVPLSFTSRGEKAVFFGMNAKNAMVFGIIWGKTIEFGRFFFWLGPLAGILIQFGLPGTSSEQRKETNIILLFLAAVLLSIFHTGHGNPHYFLQTVPMMAILAAGVIPKAKPVWLTRSAFFAFLIACCIPLYPLPFKYKNLGKIDMAQLVVSYLERYNLKDQYVYFSYFPIGYWLTGAKIPTAYAHPANIGNLYFLKPIEGDQASVANELRSIFDKKPLFVITRESVGYLDEADRQLLNQAIRNGYTLEMKLEDALIYRRQDLEILSKSWWNILTPVSRAAVIKSLIDTYETELNIAITKRPEAYVKMIDRAYSKDGEPQIPVNSLLELIAIREKDFYSGESDQQLKLRASKGNPTVFKTIDRMLT